ncbi:hypothetical protein D7B24_007573 [Verticillium nonalfalfae]|uniref:Uncharacterized protein n=1 Tax=Verticillium nonalfalfae TaxID=1051616 RepID=A0A3M9Y704_9PEZI|nr:uncharacterized protein D7B24_007573 [Verticillium nonalfalfae]RNJ56289.1 hypothetical protein D7B24_007573 [Verticillium nonalfalfae]
MVSHAVAAPRVTAALTGPEPHSDYSATRICVLKSQISPCVTNWLSCTRHAVASTTSTLSTDAPAMDAPATASSSGRYLLVTLVVRIRRALGSSPRRTHTPTRATTAADHLEAPTTTDEKYCLW